MNPEISEWLHAILRWIHVFAGIMWVGTTYFFTWLDGRFTELEKSGTKEGGNIWMVHSGGFYVVEKQKLPQLMPSTLHWFKWEAAITWLSGFLLFGLVYYHGALMLDFEDAKISKGAAIGMSVGLLLAGWAVYDLLWGKVFKNDTIGIIVSFALIVGVNYLLAQYFAGRAVFMQLGAMLGTIMTANVWMRILPPQRRMVAALTAGRQPDLTEGQRAKTRSKHNTFLAVPVVFIMISNHFPTAYGSRYDWIILSALVLVGWIAAKFVRRA